MTGGRMRRGDRGAGAVLLLAWLAVLGLAALLALAVVQVTVARHRAQAAADLAALAAASELQAGRPAVCGVAREVAHNNAARILSCQVRGSSVLVLAEVRVQLPGLLGGHPSVRVAARAGPGTPGPGTAGPDGSSDPPGGVGTNPRIP